MKKIALTIIILLLGGCATKSLPPIKKYSISKSLKVKKIADKKCKNVNISLFQSSDEILSKKIIYQKGLEKNYYYFSRWFEAPDLMVSKLIYDFFKSSSVCKESYLMMDKLNPQYTLNGKIIEFGQKFDKNGSFGVVDIMCYIENSQNDIVAQKEFISIKKAPGNNAKGGIEAINKASNEVALKILKWFQDSIN